MFHDMLYSVVKFLMKSNHNNEIVKNQRSTCCFNVDIPVA